MSDETIKVDAVLRFKAIRERMKKRQVSTTVSVDRIANVEKFMEIEYPTLRYLNNSEKADFAYYLLEGLMKASGQFPGIEITEPT